MPCLEIFSDETTSRLLSLSLIPRAVERQTSLCDNSHHVGHRDDGHRDPQKVTHDGSLRIDD